MDQDKLNITIERVNHTCPPSSPKSIISASAIEEVEITVWLGEEKIYQVRQAEQLYRNSSDPVKHFIDWCFGNSSLPDHGTRSYDELVKSATSEVVRRIADDISDRTRRLLSNIDSPVSLGLNQKPDPDN